MAITVKYGPVSGALEAAANAGTGQATAQRFAMEQQLVRQATAQQNFQDQLQAQERNQQANRQQQMQMARMSQQLQQAKMAQTRRLQPSRTPTGPLQHVLSAYSQTPSTPSATPGTGSMSFVSGPNTGESYVVNPDGTITGTNATGAEISPQTIQQSTGFAAATPQPLPADPITVAKAAYAKAMGAEHLPPSQQAQVKALIVDPAVKLTTFTSGMKDILGQSAPPKAGNLTDQQKARLTAIGHQISYEQRQVAQIAKDNGLTAAQLHQSVADFTQENAAANAGWISAGVADPKQVAIFQQVKAAQGKIASLQAEQQHITGTGGSQPAQSAGSGYNIYVSPKGGKYTWADVLQTAQQSGKTPDQVIAEAHLTQAQ